MEFPYRKKTETEDQTKELAKKFVSVIKDGDIIILNGTLGSGKTFFIKKVLEELNIDHASSPSFAIVNEYKNGRKVYHFDFYRIKEIEELFEIGFNDYINDEEAVVFIEWGNLFEEILPKKRIDISIKINEDFSREFFIKKIGQ